MDLESLVFGFTPEVSLSAVDVEIALCELSGS
jgi:hypothetical protein